MTLILKDKLILTLSDEDNGEIAIITQDDLTEFDRSVKEDKLFIKENSIIYHKDSRYADRMIYLRMQSDLKTNYGIIVDKLNSIGINARGLKLNLNTHVGNLTIKINNPGELEKELEINTHNMQIEIKGVTSTVYTDKTFDMVLKNSKDYNGKLVENRNRYREESIILYEYVGNYATNTNLLYHLLSYGDEGCYRLRLSNHYSSIVITKENITKEYEKYISKY